MISLYLLAAQAAGTASALQNEPQLGVDKFLLLVFVFVLAIFLGVELIAKVPSQLHTPLMSGSNAISGITIVAALVAVGTESTTVANVVGTIAVVAATINVVGGYLVTDRMLAMFRKKDEKKQ